MTNDFLKKSKIKGTRKGLPTILQVSFCVVVTAVEMGVR